MNFVANIPHIRCFIKKEYVHDLERGHGEYIEAVLIAVVVVVVVVVVVNQLHVMH